MLWHTTLRWQRQTDAVLEPFNLTHAQFALLSTTWYLGRGGELPNQRQVAEHAGIGEVMASQVLRLLERNGMILRQTSATDVRAMALSVTDQGQHLAERAVAALDEADSRFFNEVPDPEALLDMLRVLAGRTVTGEARERRY
ncbi:MAG: regulatory protein MarR [Subtercola sp.]|nr:regulatory protein MarR [Subtercola sp.]